MIYREKKTFEQFKHIKLYAIIFVLLGMIILLFKEGILSYQDNVNRTLKSLTESIGIIFITLGIGTLFIEIREYTNYFINRLTDIMLKNEFLDFINEEKMEEMKLRIEERLYFKNKTVTEDNFYHIVHQALKQLLNSFYYQECFILIECFIDEEKRIITKEIHKRIKVVNIVNNDNKTYKKNSRQIEIPFGGEFKKGNGMDEKEMYMIKSVICKEEIKVNGETRYKIDDHTEKVNKILKENIDNNRVKGGVDEDYYPIRLDFNYKIDTCESCTIESDVMSKVPITDKYFCNKLSSPCQDYKVIFNISNENYYLDGFAFSFLKDNYGDAALIHKSKHSILLQFTGWVMPGEGVLISINPIK